MPTTADPPSAPAAPLAIGTLIAEAYADWLWQLRNQFPNWRVWHDHAGWHGTRKGGNLREGGGVKYAVHAGDHEHLAAELGAQDKVTVPAAQRQP